MCSLITQGVHKSKYNSVKNRFTICCCRWGGVGWVIGIAAGHQWNVLPVRIFVVTISILAADKPLKISKYYLVARQLDNTIESQQHLS